MKGLVNIEKYGFKINNRQRKDWAKSDKIFVRKSVAKALLKAKKNLPSGYNILVLDGKRSLEDQRRIIKICEKDFKRRDPKNWKKMLIDFTGGYEALKKKIPMNTHRHGGAVDVTLLNEKGKELYMGNSFDESEALNYYENKRKLTKKEIKIRDNRRLLKKAMSSAGFKPHLPEWTHWGYSK